MAGHPYSKDLADVRQRIADELGCTKEEVAPTRSGTEALQNLIVNYNRLSAGDVVIYSDLDFDAMQFAMEYLAKRCGARLVRFTIPEPATRSNVLEAYDRVLKTSGAKLLLTTHVSHRTGLLMPIREIAAMAKPRSVDVIVDAAQSWGYVGFRISDLGVDFAGFSLHKGAGAPLGTGFMYIRKDRLSDINPHFENRDYPADDIRARVLTGTTNFASLLTVPVALEFHTRVGATFKEARLRYLRDRWVERVKDVNGIEILTPDDPTMHAGITSFRMKDMPAISVQKTLVEKYAILTAPRKGIARGDAVRVTPALYTLEADVDRLADALRRPSLNSGGMKLRDGRLGGPASPAPQPLHRLDLAFAYDKFLLVI